MKAYQYLIFLCILILSSLPSSAQELEKPRYGTFQAKKEIEPERSDVWKETNYFTPKKALEIPRITTDNFRKPVDMAGIVSGMEKAKKSAKNQSAIDNIRLSYATYQKDDKKPGFKLNSSLETNFNSKLPNSTCVHGKIERFCNFCSPMNNFGSFGRHGIYNSPIHPMMRGYYLP